jgi:hypothetical protein
MSALTVCEGCGKRPAAKIKLRRGVGMLLVARTYTTELNLCGICAEMLTSEYQRKTAVQGWTSVISAIRNPFFLASNAANKARHRRELENL